MACNTFTLAEVRRQFGLTLREEDNLFASATPVAISPWLQETLREFAPLALAMSTEKARSEMISAPILLLIEAPVIAVVEAKNKSEVTLALD